MRSLCEELQTFLPYEGTELDISAWEMLGWNCLVVHKGQSDFGSSTRIFIVCIFSNLFFFCVKIALLFLV
jgi:hypothetical protein